MRLLIPSTQLNGLTGASPVEGAFTNVHRALTGMLAMGPISTSHWHQCLCSPAAQQVISSAQGLSSLPPIQSIAISPSPSTLANLRPKGMSLSTLHCQKPFQLVCRALHLIASTSLLSTPHCCKPFYPASHHLAPHRVNLLHFIHTSGGQHFHALIMLSSRRVSRSGFF